MPSLCPCLELVMQHNNNFDAESVTMSLKENDYMYTGCSDLILQPSSSQGLNEDANMVTEINRKGRSSAEAARMNTVGVIMKITMWVSWGN